VRLAYFAEMRGRAIFEHLHLDPLYYWSWAVRIFSGEGAGAAAFEQSPLYPYLLAGLFRLGGGPDADLARLAGALAGAFTCAGVARLGARLEPGSGGWIAGLLAVFYGPFVFYDTMIMKTFLAAALIVASTLALLRSQAGRLGWLASAGALLGLAAMVRENLLLVAPCALVWIARAPAPGGFSPPPARLRVRSGVAYAAGLLLATAPAALHNRLVGGEWVWITAGGGEVFYIGNHPQANGQYLAPPFVRPDPQYEHEDFRAEARRRTGRPLTRSQSSRYWLLQGVDYILDHPVRWLGLEARKAIIFLNAYELPDNYNFQTFRRFSRVLDSFSFGWGALAPLGLLGIWMARRRQPAAPLLLTLAAIFSSTLLFFNFGRFRIPAAALLMPFAAVAAVEAWKLVRLARWRDLAVRAALPWLGLAFVVNVAWPSEGLFASAQDHMALAEAYRQEGRAALAEGEFREALWLVPEAASHPAAARLRAAALMALGELARERGEHALALEHLGRAAAASPDPGVRGEILEQRSDLLWRSGQSAAALRELEEAANLDPSRFRIAFKLAEYLRRLARHREAEAVLRAAAERIAPEDRAAQANFHFAMGRLLLVDLGRPAEAFVHLQQVLDLAPAHPHGEEVRRLLEQAGGSVDRRRGGE
jgi:4-amino-4-deoxy-L-arabinose transferase-like glycosyltransferase